MIPTEVLKNWPIGTPLNIQPLRSHWGRIWCVESAGGSQFVLKEAKSPSRVIREYELLRHLCGQGQPVAAPLVTTAGEPYAVQGDRTYVLARRLPGSPFSDHHAGGWEAGATACGEALARLHHCLSSFPHPHLFLRLDLPDFVAEKALPAIGRHPDAFPLDSVRRIGEDVAASLSSPCAPAVEQLVHRDPNPSNILLKDGAVTGIVDFGVVVTCLRLLDPCYLAMSMLAGSREDPEKRRAWPRVFRAIMRGYTRHMAVTDAEHRIVFPVLAAVQFIFIEFNLKLGNIGAARRNAELLRWLSDRRAEL